jgi:hypothetical protein
MTDDEALQLATDQWENEECNIEPNGRVSHVSAEDNCGIAGAWVQAWVWVEETK